MISVQMHYNVCIPFNFWMWRSLMTPGFVWEGLEGYFHATRSDEVHSFRAKKREDRFECCVARLRPLT